MEQSWAPSSMQEADMRKGLLAIVGPLLLAACQSSTSANEVQGHASQPSSAPELQQAHSSTSLCTGEQVAVISCKLETTGRIASLCAASSSDGVWKFRFLHGV